MDMSLSELQELVMDKEAWSATVQEVAKSWTQLSDWTDWPNLTKGRIGLGMPSVYSWLHHEVSPGQDYISRVE